MPDYGSRITDKAIAKSLRKIRRVYAQAEKELLKKLEAFQKRHAVKGKAMFEMLKNGEITQAQYHSWMRGQVFTGERWKCKLNQLVRLIGKTNKIAHDVVQRFRLHVFSENYNHHAYEAEIQTGISFDIYNEEAVEKLIKEDPKMLPEWRIDEEKDYIWNRQKVENAITQGIIQGESVDQIAERLAKTLSSTNMNKMRMFARTAMTGAQNAGIQKQMEDAEARGIKIKKQWLATLDDRTRDSHARLDGDTIPVDAIFSNGLKYPGDPSGAASEVYNCRCTMKSVFSALANQNKTGERRAYKINEKGYRESYIVKNMTYMEWKKWKEGHK